MTSTLVILCLAVTLLAVSANAQTTRPGMRLFIGTYNSPTSQGIYTTQLQADGTLAPPELAAAAQNASFLALHPTLPVLYAINEVGKFRDQKTGAVTAFSIGQDAQLKTIADASSGGPGPCYIEVGPDGRFALVANYGGGSVAMLPIGDDGAIGPASDVVQHEGKSVNPRRQEKPHAHQFRVDPTGKFALASDLGIDQVRIYRIDGPKLVHAGEAASEPGAGPRHFDFSPDGKSVYLCNELNNTLVAYTWKDGRLTAIQSLPTLPAEFKGQSSTANVAVHRSGKFVYVSNRGHDSIAGFSIDPISGKMTLISHTPTAGKTPRHFAIDPAGRWLVAANQDSNNVVVFAIEPDGRLTPTGRSIEVGKPVCVLFAR